MQMDWPDPGATNERLDLLLRDWQLSGAYGADAGQEYLGEITQDLEVSAEQPLVLEALRASGTRCYLLPHPGTQFTRSRAGTPDDIDEDFRQCLCEYITSVVHSAGTHVRTDRAGQVLTGAQLAARIKGVSRYWKTQRYDFSSPMKAPGHPSLRLSFQPGFGVGAGSIDPNPSPPDVGQSH
ncbi:RING finger protein 112-like isoform X2 [Chrysemys picta bellii]|uniref:RING finger protein 112-like isoform X2 n=1 Tax=Chrysemys picta bellii TaxID=8478 RepID=UPI0032B24E85